MPWKPSVIIMCALYFNYGETQDNRRLVLGSRIYNDKRYMVYLLKSAMSNTAYDNWMCAGAIVSPSFVLTSGACLKDVPYLYVIAGYNKYVRSEFLDRDNCTRERKNKVVKTCVPKSYNFTYKSLKNWVYLDIGLAIVEKPFNFSDLSYRDYCSYVPQPIRINFDPKYTAKETDACVYGWGDLVRFREPGEYQDYNQLFLTYVNVVIVDKTVCTDALKGFGIIDTIYKYMLCSYGMGNIDSEGNTFRIEAKYDDGIQRRYMEHPTTTGYFNSSRNESFQYDMKYNNSAPKFESRRQGPCQNDHGAPLVVWIGSVEYVVGVSITGIRVKQHGWYCRRPYIYTSTQCLSRFIKCAMREPTVTRRMCDNMGIEEGYEIHETEMNWDLANSYLKNDPNDTTTTKQDVASTPADDEGDDDIFKPDPIDFGSNENDKIDDYKQIFSKIDLRTQKQKESGEPEKVQPRTTEKFDVDPVIDDVIVI